MQCFKRTEEKKWISSEFKGTIEDKEQMLLVMSREEMRHYHKCFNWPERTLRACLSDKQIPQVEIHETFDFGILQRPILDTNHYKTQFFSFYITSHYLVLILDTRDEWIESFCQSLIGTTEEEIYDISSLFFRLLDEVIEDDPYYLDTISEEIEHLETCVFNEENIEFSREMMNIRKKLSFFKKHYDPLVDIIEDLAENEKGICSSQGIRYFKILRSRVNRLRAQVDYLGEYTTHVREAYDAQVDIKQNRIMKYFTLIASIFLPLTLIVGWYGMNFTTMPELTWKYGYVYVIALSFFSSLLCLYCFKKKRWM